MDGSTFTLPPRQRLPNRRINCTQKHSWNGNEWSLCVGFDERGKVREIFVGEKRTGCGVDLWADQTCILVSFLLQSGFDAQRLLDKIASADVNESSLVESALRAAVAIEAKEGPGIAALFGGAA